MITQFFIVNLRGDTVISKQYRGSSHQISDTIEIFNREIFGKEVTTPVFAVENLHFIYITRESLYFAFVLHFAKDKDDSSIVPSNPGYHLLSISHLLELLQQTFQIFKDYCGIISEESIKRNFPLIYELLDEILDFGYPQSASSDSLQNMVFNDPTSVNSIQMKSLSIFDTITLFTAPRDTAPEYLAHKPLITRNSSNKSEIYIDFVENIMSSFDEKGQVLLSEVTGSVIVKSFLSSSPTVRLIFNNTNTVFDDCNFHDCVLETNFTSEKTMSFQPPKGEFVVMNYRVTKNVRLPFVMTYSLHEVSNKVEMVVKVQCLLHDPNQIASNVKMTLGLSKWFTGRVYCELEPQGAKLGQSAEFNEHQVCWQIPKFYGNSQHTLKIKLNATSAASVKTRMGRISLHFEVPMWTASNLQLASVNVVDKYKSFDPVKWIRYVTKSNSVYCK